jgi:hypothetical protein
MSVAGQPLRVSIVATHAGRITRNHGFYLPQKMRDGAKTLMSEYGKPILLHHNDHNDPVGRVIAARYVDTSGTFTRDSAQDSLIKRICDSRTPFFTMLDLFDQLSETDLLKDPAFPGLGHIVVDADISDENAIKKILDKRYLTVSIGATTDRAVCSVCKTDWVEEGRCEHIPGKNYEDKLCVVIAGSLFYDEVSFVNAPADPLARVVAVGVSGGVHDSVIGEEVTDSFEVNASFSFQDTVSATTGGNEMEKIKEAWEKALKVASDESADKELRLKALNDFLEEFKDAKENPYKEEAEATITKLTEPEPDTQDDASTQDDAAQDNDDAAVQDDADSADDSADNDDAGDSEPAVDDGLTDEQWADADQHYEDMLELGFALSLFDDTQDAKLTPEKRKSLKKGTFCKPGERKYPVPDCSHARSAMAYAKKYNEASSVLACIRRKAKALGCPFNGKDGFEAEIDEILKDLEQREMGDEQNTNTDNQNAQDQADNTAQDNDTCESCEEYKDQLKALRQELKDIYNEAAEDEKLFTDVLKKARLALADALTRLGVVSSKEIKDFEKTVKEVAALKIEDLLSKANEVKESLDLEAVVTKLNDGMSREPTDTVDDPTGGDKADTDPTAPEKNEEDKFSRIRNAYQNMFRDDPDKADAYLTKLRNEGIIPADFDPRDKNKEESE